MNKETKDLANSSSGGAFLHLRVSEAKRVLEKLLSAKRAYDSPRDNYPRRGVASADATDREDKVELRMDKVEKAVLSAIEKNTPATPAENKVAEQGGQNSAYDQPSDLDNVEQVNAAGYWNPNGSWNPGKPRDAPWRDHPNFRWGDGNQNQSQNQNQNQSQNQYNPPQNKNSYRGPTNPDHQSNWPARNQQQQN